MRFWVPRALIVAVALVVLAEVWTIAPRADVLPIIATQLWMALPGVFLARHALRPSHASPVLAWLVGPALGFGFSVFGLLLLWSAGVQGWLSLIAGPFLTWALGIIAWRTGGLRIRVPELTRSDRVAFAIILLIVPLITWAPYDHVAEPVADGHAYRAYFTADFVWAMTVTAELAKGDVPPANPFLTGQTLHYYWLSHLLSGAVYRNVQPWGVSAEQVVLLSGLAFSTAFVGFFYALVRWAGGSPVFSALAVAVGFLANSYEAVDRFWEVRGLDVPYFWRMLNIDAVTRWFYDGMPVDGLQRLFLYQPHHLTGYVLALSAVWLLSFAEDVSETSITLGAGVLLALSFLFSTFTAVIVGVAAGAVYVLRLIAGRKLLLLPMGAILAGGPVIVAVFVSFLLGYTEPSASSLVFIRANPVAFRRWPFILLLSFGPLLFAGVAGLIRFRWLTRDGLAAAAIVGAAFAFYFFVDVADMGNVWVGWRSGHLLLIAFAVMGAAAMTAAWRIRAARLPLAAAATVAVALAVPTVYIDVYNAQDIENRERGPSFPWTLVITPQEREAFDWIKRSTPPEARVQMDPIVRASHSWALIPAFAERRMAAGLPISMIPLQPYRDRSDHVRMGIYMAPSPKEAHAMAEYLGVDYLYVGDLERSRYPGLTDALNERPDLFPVVFRNGSVTIHAVTHSD